MDKIPKKRNKTNVKKNYYAIKFVVLDWKLLIVPSNIWVDFSMVVLYTVYFKTKLISKKKRHT